VVKAEALGRRARRAATLVGGGLLALTAALAGTERARERAAAPSPRTLSEALGLAPPADVAGAAAAWDIAGIDHDRIDYWIDRFQTDKRADFETYLARMGRYAALIASALTERDMPQDLLYLAMIESGFDPTAYSRAKASGLWQFISETGARYGLDINRAVDERNDPVKATGAALAYLRDLYERFGSWHLAAAAYNTGENRVGRIMREVTGSERGTDADYYRIWDRLPRETRDYVPLMAAAARIARDPASYGFGHVSPQASLAFAEVEARPATPLKTLARRAGTTVSELKRLNPQLKLDRTRNDEPMVVRVPAAEPEAPVAPLIGMDEEPAPFELKQSVSQ
jgi:membrane-bound lytic murein transglycosylase D